MGHADRAEHVEHVVHAACPRGGPHLSLRRLQSFVGHAQLYSGILKDSLPVWCLADAAGRVQAKGSFGCLGILGNQCSHLLPPLKTVAACPESFVTHPSVGKRGGMWGGRGGWRGGERGEGFLLEKPTLKYRYINLMYRYSITLASRRCLTYNTILV